MKASSFMYELCRRKFRREWGTIPNDVYYDIKVLQGQNEYTLHELRSVKISMSLTSNSGIDIGNANSNVCKITVMEESSNWDRMAQFTVQFRIVDIPNSINSDWITAGVFYTDERSEDTSGNLVITGYDAMLMHERTWADKVPQAYMPANFPITAKAWATMIENSGLANFEDLTQLDDTVAFVGLDTAATIRDTLKSIAAANAGNWTIVGSDSLRLVHFENVDVSETSKYVTLNGADLPTDYIQASKFETTPAFDEVSGVHLETEAGTVMEAGDDDGYVVKSVCSVSTTTGVAALCLSKIEEYVYRPFEATGARLDPLVDLGDSVYIDEVMYQIISIDWNFAKMLTATASAPYDQEIDHEYVIPDAETKMYRKAMSGVDARMGQYATQIEQNEQAITLLATHTEEIDQQIASLQDQIDGNIQSWSGNVVPTLNNSPASDWTTSALKAEHVGDLYFVNSDAGIPEAGTYYRFEENNGVYSWVVLSDTAITEALTKAAAALAAAESAEDAAEESLGIAQSKGRIFVTQPTDAQAYDVGDLWVNATYGSTYSNDVLKCKTAKAAGAAFNIAHWELASKYTDDAAVNALRTEVEAELSVQADNIAAKVSQTGGNNTTNSFSWQLNSSGHRWYANGGVDPVVSITGTGLAVKGEINATSGYIGNGSSGFTIGSTSIYNGMTSMSDTDHYGVYLGTDGIALGKGAFRVTNTGQLYAQSGTFEGNVYARNINYGGDYGTLSGAGITPYTIGDSNIARAGDYGALTTAALSSGVQGSLALADNFGLATTQSSTWKPSYFAASNITALNSFYAPELYLELGGDSQLAVKTHYHSITVSGGTVTIGHAVNLNSAPSFNIADTQFYRDGVAAVTVSSRAVLYCNASNYTSFDTGFDCDMSGSSYHYDSNGSTYGRLEIRNSSGTALKTIRVKLPAGGSGSISSITVIREHDPRNYSTIRECMADWDLSETNPPHVYVKVKLQAYSGSTAIGSVYDGRVCVDDIADFFATEQSTILATTSTSQNNNYDIEVDTTGYTNAFFKVGSYQYVRFQLQNEEGDNLDIVRVKMASTDTAITEVFALTSNSSTYTDYDWQATYAASSVYTPSGSSTQYARVQVNLNNGTNKKIRVALPASANVTDIQSKCTSADYSDYWQNSLGQWMLKVRAMSGSTQLYEKSLNVQHAVNYGGTLSWDIHQHYDMGQADGWDCVVTTGSGQQHTFWSPSRIYQ